MGFNDQWILETVSNLLSSGITYATNLVTFVAANNRIDDLLAITELPKIKTIDLEK